MLPHSLGGKCNGQFYTCDLVVQWSPVWLDYMGVALMREPVYTNRDMGIHAVPFSMLPHSILCNIVGGATLRPDEYDTDIDFARRWAAIVLGIINA